MKRHPPAFSKNETEEMFQTKKLVSWCFSESRNFRSPWPTVSEQSESQRLGEPPKFHRNLRIKTPRKILPKKHTQKSHHFEKGVCCFESSPFFVKISPTGNSGDEKQDDDNHHNHNHNGHSTSRVPRHLPLPVPLNGRVSLKLTTFQR